MVNKTDNSLTLGVMGFSIGGLLGYLLRPSIPLIGQLPFETVITRGANLEEFEFLILGPSAVVSFNYLVVGAILGLVIGWVVGKFIK